MKKLVRNLFCSSILMLSGVAIAEVAVIVNPANGDTITKDDIQKVIVDSGYYSEKAAAAVSH